MDGLSFSSSNTVFFYRQTEDFASVVWKVRFFSTLEEEVHSSTFSFKEGELYLTLCAEGTKEDDNEGYVGLFLAPCSSFPTTLRYRFSLKDESGDDVLLSEIIENNFGDKADYGVFKFINRQDLLDGKLGNLLPGDVLTVCCIITTPEYSKADVSADVMLPVPEKFALSFEGNTFPSHFREVFENGKFSDVLLRVGKETIRAHKVILSTQSSVFKAMFDSDMKESRDNTVDLIDMDETVAKAMLHYMYAWNVEALSAEKTLELYAAADRYMLTELKDKCREFVSSHLSAKNIGQVFEVAGLHSDDVLIKTVLKFFAENAKSIIKTKEFEDFSNEKPASSNRLLRFAITGNVFF